MQLCHHQHHVFVSAYAAAPPAAVPEAVSAVVIELLEPTLTYSIQRVQHLQQWQQAATAATAVAIQGLNTYTNICSKLAVEVNIHNKFVSVQSIPSRGQPVLQGEGNMVELADVAASLLQHR